MKRIVITIIFISAVFSNAQITLPIEDHKSFMIYGLDDDFEDQLGDQELYYKDFNNDLDKFTGTWLGQHNNSSFFIIIDKYTQDLDTFLKVDKLSFYYQITDSNGNVVFNNISDSPIQPESDVIAYYYDSDNRYEFSYLSAGIQNGCIGWIGITVINNTTLRLNYVTDVTMSSENCFSHFPELEEEGSIILQKQ